MANKFVKAKIKESANRVKKFIEQNKALPNYVDLNGIKVSMPDYLYLLTKVVNTTITKTDPVNVTQLTVKAPSTEVSSYKTGNLKKVDYKDLATRIYKYIESNHQAPSYGNTSLGKIPFSDLVYTFSVLLAYIYTDGKLLDNLQVKPIKTTSVASTSDDPWTQLEKGVGKTYASLTAITNDVIKYCSYDYYYDDIKTFKQELQSLINAILGIDDGDNCVDYAQCQCKLARARGYTCTILGVWCDKDGIWHAICHVQGKEFEGKTCVINNKTVPGILLDWAKLASEGGAIGSHWCNANEAVESPAWAPYE